MAGTEAMPKKRMLAITAATQEAREIFMTAISL
jgi:hypothetical protein